MIRITVEGKEHDKAGKDLKHFFQTGQRKIVKHFVIGPDEWDLIDASSCDVAIIEIKEKQEQ